MTDLVYALTLFAGLCASYLAGRGVQRALPEGHRTRETLDFVRVASGLLVTFTALVLSLLLAAVNEGFRKANADLQSYGTAIVLLGDEFAGLGPAAGPLRAELRGYTAAALASTWPEEPAPSGSYPRAGVSEVQVDSAELSALLHRIEGEVRRVAPADGAAEKAQAACLALMASLLERRGTLIGDAHGAITPLFFEIMVLWLVLVFLSFGLTGPDNRTTASAVATIAFAIASAVFLMSELDSPLDGAIKVGSEPLRTALEHLDRPAPAP